MNEAKSANSKRSYQAITEVAETIGVRLTLRLVEVFGGLEISFPLRPADDHPVIVALGKEDGYAICKFMGGSAMSVPHLRPRKNARADIARLEADGLTRKQIARELGLTERWVREMSGERPSPQMDLFGHVSSE